MPSPDRNEVRESIPKGRPRKLINGDLVTEMVRKGQPLREIIKVFSCSRDTIYSRYGECVKKGRELNGGRPVDE